MTTNLLTTTREVDALIADAADDPSPATLGELLRVLTDLRAGADTTEGRLRFQRQLYELHYGAHQPSHELRQWLASTTYGYFEETAPVPASNDDPGGGTNTVDPTADFLSELALQQRARSPLHHPLLQHCYSDASSFEDLKVYLRHKWIIMLTFWRSLSEFGNRLQRTDFDNTALVYENVHEELGTGSVAEAHLVKHHRLLTAIGVDAGWDDEPEYAETYEYINFRMFCMRNPEVAWGLGSFYSQEATSLEYTIGHYDQLRRHGVSHDLAEIYYSHEEIDSEHTDEVVQMIRSLVSTPEQRRIVLTAQDHQMALWNRHFDRVWAEVRGAHR